MINAINSFFVSALNWIYGWCGNYGWSVVIFTLLIRMALLPLDFKSRRGMYAMTRVQPKLAVLQKKYANDKEKLNQKTMELYKKEGVSPLAGCLPMLLQYPILIFMFTAMRVVANEHTIQMLLDMQAGNPITFQGWLWIKNVFQPDSFMASIIPDAKSLQAISAVAYSKILTPENIEAAKAFLASEGYAAQAANYVPANAFAQYTLNFLIVRPTLTLPTSFAAFWQYTNGLFLLPLFAGLSQFFMTKVMNAGQPKMTEEEKLAKKQQEEANPNPMNGGFMKWFFPLFSVWICASSNAAFSIYWMAVNVIMIVTTYVMNKMLGRQYDAKEAEQESTK